MPLPANVFPQVPDMSSQSEVMHCYEQIAGSTECMLAFARAGQWADLPAQEAVYTDMVDRLRQIEALESLLESQLARKYQLLGRILSSHAELSSLLMPQLAHLGQVVRSLEQQDSLERAYGLASDIRL